MVAAAVDLATDGGYDAVQIGLVEKNPPKRSNKATVGHHKKANVPPTRVQREVRVAKGAEAPKPGDQVLVSIFNQGERVDVIVTNPPFGGEEERGILGNFPEDKQTSETALLFLQLIMRKLKRLEPAIGLSIWGALFTYKRSVAMQNGVDKLMLRLPVFGDVIKKASIARWCRRRRRSSARRWSARSLPRCSRHGEGEHRRSGHPHHPGCAHAGRGGVADGRSVGGACPRGGRDGARAREGFLRDFPADVADPALRDLRRSRQSRGLSVRRGRVHRLRSDRQWPPARLRAHTFRKWHGRCRSRPP